MKKLAIRLALSPLAAASLTLASLSAHAVDGVLLIDQARALAGNVTLGDAPGFPVTISTSGSYRLATNLNLGASAMGTTAIEIRPAVPGTKLSVTLDLNGFSIVGLPVCDFNGQGDVACGAGGPGDGIYVASGSSAGITQGAVRGMGRHGIFCEGECRVASVTLANNGNFGVAVTGNGHGILVGNSIFLNRRGVTGSRLMLERNAIDFNLENAVSASYSQLVGNVISGNGGFGLAGTANGYAHNTFSANNGGNSAQQVGPTSNVQTGGNVCGTALCP